MEAAEYVDDVIITTENEEDLKRTTSKLIKEEEKIRSMVNEKKTKYMIVVKCNYKTRKFKL